VPPYGGRPPIAPTVTSVVPLLQFSGTALEDAFSFGGSVMVTVAVLLQPRASVTVKECVPAWTRNVPTPEYGATPPLASTVTGVLFPAQSRGCGTAVTVNPLTVTEVGQTTVCTASRTITDIVYPPGPVPASTTTDCPV